MECQIIVLGSPLWVCEIALGTLSANVTSLSHCFKRAYCARHWQWVSTRPPFFFLSSLDTAYRWAMNACFSSLLVPSTIIQAVLLIGSVCKFKNNDSRCGSTGYLVAYSAWPKDRLLLNIFSSATMTPRQPPFHVTFNNCWWHVVTQLEGTNCVQHIMLPWKV